MSGVRYRCFMNQCLSLVYDSCITRDVQCVAEIRTIVLFCQLGLETFGGVGIIGFNSPEWFISDLAAIYAGLVFHVCIDVLFDYICELCIHQQSKLISCELKYVETWQYNT